jgi:heptosyltransferase-2
MQFSNILVRATNWVGDAVLCIPALQQLRVRFPHAHISILAKPWVAAIYGREAFCDEVIPYEPQTLWQKHSAAQALRSGKYDCALLLQNAFEAAAVSWLARIPVRIGYNRDARGWLLTNAVSVPVKGDIPKHQRFYYLELLKRAGLIDGYDSDAPIQLAGASAAAKAGRQRLQDLVPAESVIGVSPGAAFGSAKRWLPERFAEAAIEVATDCGCAVAVMGSHAERNICEHVRTRVSDAGVKSINLAGQTTLDSFIEIVAACRLMLTNDSGAMHIAYALGVPTVTVFGATDDEATGPTGPKARVVREPVECSPCLLRECPIDHRCMTRVSVSRVVLTALEVIHGR